MALIPTEAMPYFENMIYLPMILIILDRDRETIEKSPFKLKRPYFEIVDRSIQIVRAELHETTIYLRQHNMSVERGKSDDTFTTYLFKNGGREDERRYLNIRLRNRTEELLRVYFLKMGSSHSY